MFYRRHLPHWDPGGEVLFVTWRLHPRAPTAALADPAVADLVDSALRHGDLRMHLYRRLASTVMPDHVHLLVAPGAPMPRITHSLKSFTAHEAATRLGFGGQPFWQSESFDHWLRSDAEVLATARYIVANPPAETAALRERQGVERRTGVLACLPLQSGFLARQPRRLPYCGGREPNVAQASSPVCLSKAACMPGSRDGCPTGAAARR